ncbi:MAG: hypothetical protein RLY70_2591 [Planctomycetota bacterium]
MERVATRAQVAIGRRLRISGKRKTAPYSINRCGLCCCAPVSRGVQFRSSALLRVACSQGRQAGAAIGVPRRARRARSTESTEITENEAFDANFLSRPKVPVNLDRTPGHAMREFVGFFLRDFVTLVSFVSFVVAPTGSYDQRPAWRTTIGWRASASESYFATVMNTGRLA